MKYFDFTGLIRKYTTSFKVISSGKGYYNDLGDYVESEPTESLMQGAIISLKEDKIYRSEGLLTEQDRQLFMTEPLPKGLIGSKVIYKGNKYKVQESTDNSEFTGVYAYVLKFVSAFNGGDSSA